MDDISIAVWISDTGGEERYDLSIRAPCRNPSTEIDIRGKSK